MKQAIAMGLFAVITGASVETLAADPERKTVVIPVGNADLNVVEIGTKPAQEAKREVRTATSGVSRRTD